MRKKLLTILTVLLMCVVALPTTAFAIANAASTEVQSVTPVEITPDYSWYSADATEYTISSVEQLAGLAKLTQGAVTGVTSAATNFAGKTVKLTADLTFADEQYWYYNDGSGTVYDYRIYSFAGTFDGTKKAATANTPAETYTITELKISCAKNSISGMGLFTAISGAVSNLTLDNVKGSFADGNQFGFLAATLTGTATNCHITNVQMTSSRRVYGSGMMFGGVENSSVDSVASVIGCTLTSLTGTWSGNDNTDRVGGLIGAAYGATSDNGTKDDTSDDVISYVIIKNCSVADVNYTFSYKTKHFGAFIGKTDYTEVSYCEASNITITSADYYYNTGGFVGYVGNGSIYQNCTVSTFNMTGNAPITGGIGGNVGGFAGIVSGSAISFTDCDVTGVNWNLGHSNDYAFGVGGFAGKLSSSDITICDCSASGDITAAGNGSDIPVGGFAGEVNNTVTITDCTTSVNVTGSDTVGGFVGACNGGTAEFTNCEATGSVKSADGIAGGMVGYVVSDANPTFSNCDPADSVTGVITNPVANAQDKNYVLQQDGSIIATDTNWACKVQVAGLGNDYSPYYYIGYDSIQEAVNSGADNVILLANSTENFTLSRTATDSFTLDLGAFTYNGVITVPNEIGSFAVSGTNDECNVVLTEPFKDHYSFNGWCNGTDNTQSIAPTAANGWLLTVGQTYHPHFTESTYEHLTVEQLHPDFGEIYYGTTSESKYVTFVKKDASDTDVITEIIAEADYFDVTYEGLTLIVTPKANLDVGTYEELIHVRVSDGSTHGVTAKITVKKSQAVIDIDTSDIVVVQGQEWQLPSASTNVGVVKTDKTVADMSDVGTYTVTYSVDETDNYYGDVKQVKVTVILNPSDVQTNLDNAVQAINTAINTKASAEELESAINNLDAAYKLADTTLQSALQGKIDVNTTAITNLQAALTTAENTLDEAIKKVAADLETAKNNLQAQIDTLTTSVGTNATDIAELEKAISDLDTAYQAADIIINGRLDTLESADATIKASIKTLENTMTAADETLTNAIKAVEDKLDNAVADLNKAITDGDTDLQGKIDALDTAYKAADTAINSEIVKLQNEDTAIKQSVAALETALNNAKSELKGLIDQVQKNLDDAEAELNAAIAQNKTDLTAEIANLKSATESADAVINSTLADLAQEDMSIRASITALTGDLADAKSELEKLVAETKTELQGKIDEVKTELEKAKTDLNTAIAQNKTDLTKEIEALRKAMEDADALINGDIANLENADTAIKADIAEIETSLADAKTDLENAIATVQSNLDTAVENLNNAIAQNKTDLAAEIEAVETALTNTDTVINGKIAELVAEDTEINASISSLESSIANTKTELKDLIDTVAKNLETAKSELNTAIVNGDSALDEKITALDSAYKAADALINGALAELVADDEEMTASIMALENSLATVKSELEAAIIQLEQKLTQKDNDLEAKDAELSAAIESLNTTTTVLIVILSIVGVVSIGSAAVIVITLVKKRKK